MTDPDLPGSSPPDWYLAMQAAKNVGLPFTVAEGIPYGPVVRGWSLIALSAEAEAEKVMADRAAKKRTKK